MVPAADGVGHGGGLGEAHPLQCLQRAGVVLHPGEDQAAIGRRQLLAALEQLAIAPVDPDQHRLDPGVEGRQIPLPRQRRHIAPALEIDRQDVALLIGQHLHTMLQPAQLDIGGGQFVARLGRHMAPLGQRLQRLQRARRAQALVAPAQDQLLRLDVELDLADAAAPQLQIGPRRLQPFAGLVDVDLFLDRLDIQHRLVVQAAPPDVRDQRLQERRPLGRVPGADPRLDEGRPLPVLADRFIVGQGHGRRDHRRGRGRIGPQPQVHPEDIAVRRPLAQQARQTLGQAVDEALRLYAFAKRAFQDLRLEEERQVDVRGIVELERPALAHGQDEQARHGAARIVGGRGQLAAPSLIKRHAAQGRLRRRVGEARQGACHRIQAPDPAEIRQGRQQMQFGFQMPQRCLGLVRGAVDGVGRGQDFGQPRLGRRLKDLAQPLRPAPRQPGQIGRGCKHRLQRPPGPIQRRAPAPLVCGLDQPLMNASRRLDVAHRPARLQPRPQMVAHQAAVPLAAGRTRATRRPGPCPP
ncbi:hypothetical protein D3C86_1133900 [compost metagenome]